jgi:hypothetical protein
MQPYSASLVVNCLEDVEIGLRLYLDHVPSQGHICPQCPMLHHCLCQAGTSRVFCRIDRLQSRCISTSLPLRLLRTLVCFPEIQVWSELIVYPSMHFSCWHSSAIESMPLRQRLLQSQHSRCNSDYFQGRGVLPNPGECRSPLGCARTRHPYAWRQYVCGMLCLRTALPCTICVC